MDIAEVEAEGKRQPKMPRRIAKRCKECLQMEWTSAKEAFWEVIHFVKTHKWKQTLRFVVRRKFWPWWFLLIVVVALSTVLSSYHHQIVYAMKPYSDRISNSGYAWIVPLVLLIIVSFPPLFGHELILLLCGMIFGLGKGFAIAAAGTFLGELACYVAFKYLFRARAAKLEAKHIIYACIAQLMRQNGIGMLVLVRFSALPGHLVTAIQSTIGIGVTRYAIAAFLTLPKQFALVYIGKVYGETGSKSETGSEAQDTHQQTRISLIVFAATGFATVIAAYIVWQKARRIRPSVLLRMEEERKLGLQDQPTMTAMAELPYVSRDNSRATSFDGGKAADLIEDNNLVRPMTFPDADESKLSRPPLLTKDSSASLLGSNWSIHTPPLGPNRGRSDTIERILLDTPTSRSRSETVSTLSRSPSLPYLPAYFELSDGRQSAAENEENIAISTQSRRLSAHV